MKFWELKNATWFVYDGKTFLKLHGGPHATAFCLETRQRIVFMPQNAKVTVS